MPQRLGPPLSLRLSRSTGVPAATPRDEPYRQAGLRVGDPAPALWLRCASFRCLALRFLATAANPKATCADPLSAR